MRHEMSGDIIGQTHASVGSTKPQQATVENFLQERGFGFAVFQDGTKALLHESVLKARGCVTVPNGALIMCRTKARTDGSLRVTELLAIDWATAQPIAPLPQKDAQHSLPFDTHQKAAVKWFNKTKGYGFVGLAANPDDDIFLHISVCLKGGIAELADDQQVWVTCGPGKKPGGLQVTSIRI